MRVKGETEESLSKIGFKRLDLLQPGLLRGPREDDPRMAEGIGQIVAPFIDPFLGGKLRDYRSIDARIVAQAALGFSSRKAAGRFTAHARSDRPMRARMGQAGQLVTAMTGR